MYGTVKIVTTLLDNNNDSSLLARIGGEEFIVLLPNTTMTTALSYAEQLRMAIEETNIPHAYSRCSDHITISLGVSTSIELNLEKKLIPLIDKADNQLYKAKENGRNQVYSQKIAP